jgi:hypothetical protein
MCVHMIRSSVEPESLSEIEAAIDQAFRRSAIRGPRASALPPLGRDQTDQESRSTSSRGASRLSARAYTGSMRPTTSGGDNG